MWSWNVENCFSSTDGGVVFYKSEGRQSDKVQVASKDVSISLPLLVWDLNMIEFNEDL